MAKPDKTQRRKARKRAQHRRAQEGNAGSGPSWAPGTQWPFGPDLGRLPEPETEAEPISIEAVMQVLIDAAGDSLGGDTAAVIAWVSELTSGYLGHRPHIVDTAVAHVLRVQVERLWSSGWLPADLHQMVRRNSADLATALVVDAVADAFARYPAATTHPRWHSQVRELDAAQWWDTSRPYPGQWAKRYGADRETLLMTVITLLALFLRLPALQLILPLPGQAHDVAAHKPGSVDEKVLGRVRGLLAKAESTSFPEEAEALSAKAQELMSRYSIEHAMAEHRGGPAAVASARRIWLDSPYLGAKTLLVAEVGSANHCKVVSSEKLGFVTVLGDEVDLDVVEVLTTSLLVQATRAMLAAGSQVTRTGTSRTRSFRHSFLLSYATRIGERLRDTAEETEAASGTHLVPVFAERAEAVERLVGSLFTRTVQRSFSAGNSAGWGAGRSAADQAVLKAERPAVSPR